MESRAPYSVIKKERKRQYLKGGEQTKSTRNHGVLYSENCSYSSYIQF